MKIKTVYPELYQLFGGYFSDAAHDDVNDEDVVDVYKKDISVAIFEEVKMELDSLISNIEDYWEDVGLEANRWLQSKQEVLEWLEMIRAKMNE